MKTQKDYAKTALRLPRELHQSLHQTAKEAERSYNAEIIHRLRGSYQAAQQTQGAQQ